jgi:opacity protein-like surface antigen
MKSSSILAFAVITGAGLSTALAQTPPPGAASRLYVEAGYAATRFRASDGVDSIRAVPRLVVGTIGYQAHSNLAIEGFLGHGSSKGKVKRNGVGTPANVRLGDMVGLFVRPSVAVNGTLELFGRAGWVYTELKTSAPGLSGSEKDASMAYGFGANIRLSRPAHYLQVNWMRHYQQGDTRIEGFGLAYGLRF